MKATELLPHYTTEELEVHYRKATLPVERSRWQILWLKSKGYTISEIMATTGFSRSVISTLFREYNAKKEDAVRDKRQDNGSELALSKTQIDILRREIIESPDKIWTKKTTQQYIEEHFGIKVTDVCAWGYLRRLGFTRQMPRPQHIKSATEEQKAAFIKK